MREHTVEVTLPDTIYSQLQQVADACDWTFEEVLLQTIKNGVPPLLGKVPEEFHAELLALNQLDDEELWRVVTGDSPVRGRLSSKQRQADFPTLRRSYAFALLKWRGHPVPLPYEFFVE
jgi:hypothetical protein